MRVLLTIILGGLYFICHGQDERVSRINNVIRQINKNDKLTITEFDANEVYGQVSDGGGIIKVYSDKKEIIKIEQEIGVSFGRLTTIIYVTAGKPIKIIDREEIFKFKDDQTGWDYTKLTKVFEATIYIFDWDIDDSKVIYNGKRVLSEGTCSNFEYEPLLETVQKLIDKR
ncbi:hypothetical protein QWY31_16410 [Cytophagales bacterium LB-30]|uniref:Uncharacterized protein n=1 Tax=Shiella aurantiaca TaxID=3058365 RepID=A0ABT8F9D0_9BACT|nr:hypothetical protein [Shiella aurantiaca]MDN4167095.1 hypothetical protein [Shiella aurantiaca]